MEKHKNPPAFPEDQCEASYCAACKEPHRGMTLLDYFAAKALQGLISGRGGPITNDTMESWVKWSYGVAESMITEKERLALNKHKEAQSK